MLFTEPMKSVELLVLKSDASIGLAKMRVNSVIANLAEEFRM